MDMLGDIPNVLIPMQTLIEYKGYRVVALPILPVSKESLVLGSSDAGKTMLNKDVSLTETFRRCAEELYLAAHYVTDMLIYTAGDVEVHLFNDESVYCLLDLARCFPPEEEEAVHSNLKSMKSSVFFRMLRPELLNAIKNYGAFAMRVIAISFSRLILCTPLILEIQKFPFNIRSKVHLRKVDIESRKDMEYIVNSISDLLHSRRGDDIKRVLFMRTLRISKFQKSDSIFK
jgi:hypothetical protein